MHTMDAGRSGDMMAAWLATGGAIEAMGRSGDRAMGDDGLQAMTPTDFNVCYVDDGLAASMASGYHWCYADDGLQASMYSIGGGAANCPHADDGLGAMAYSRGMTCVDDDGLAASVGTFQRPWCIAD